MSEISHEELLENLFDGVYYVDLNRRISFWNKAAERITGYRKSEVVGFCCADNILRHVDDEGRGLCVEGCPLTATMQDGRGREATVYLHHKQGHRVPVSIRTSPVRDETGAVVGAVEIFSDNSNHLQILRELETLRHDAYVDRLTSVGNRRHAEMSLHTRVYEWHTFGVPFGVIFLDIDHFKRCNDTYGHATGDAVLVMVARMMVNLQRRSDTVSRWGGEEFAAIFPHITAEVLGRVAERLRVFIEQTFIMVENEKLHVTASLGATLATSDDTPDTIMHRVDALMYASKMAGRNRVTMG
jgi:diguanylate cyclase (GGDEF)-like protein/PAS domain S-box-containing protein